MPTLPPQPSATCAELVRACDWARTRVGPYEQWPERLKGYVAMVLEMPTPAIIFWGPDQVQIYNDGYAVIMGPRHPTYFGATYRECWPDTYPVIYPWMQRVLRGEVIEVDSTLFTLTRHGFTEEAYFSFTFSPLRDDAGAIAGILQPVVEVTQKVVADRRAQTLYALPHATGGDVATTLFEALRSAPKDLTFGLFYRTGGRGELQLAASCGIADSPATVPPTVTAVLASGEAVVVEASSVLGDRDHHCEWGEPTRTAFVVPVQRSRHEPLRGIAVFGISPRLRFDDAYRSFFEAIARELAAQLDAEHARQAELDLQQLTEAARVEVDAERKRLQSVFENAPVAIAIMSGPEWVVEMANPRISELWGRPLGEILHRPLFQIMPELVGQGLEELLAGVRTTGIAYVGTERPVRIQRRPDGPPDALYFNFVYEPLRTAAGDVESILVVAIDMTANVLARQAAETLAMELDISRRDAIAARDVAQQANRAKDEFLAMLGHELRNPLAPIFTALELMRMRDGGASVREREVIERQARHLRVLVEDLLDVSRITSGKVELKRSVGEIGPIVAKAIETASPLLEKHRHELRVEVPPGLVVDGDAARLTQVFANLLTNAAKYTEAGGRVTIQGHRDGSDIVISVSDTGRGMSPEMLPRVFELFVQEQQNLDRSLGGLGLGLAIVKNLVLMHGGSVEARSAGPAQGSTFIVRLPAVASASAIAAAHRKSVAALAATEHASRVLIVDDNEDAASLLAEMLGAIGYDCTIAYDGPGALEIARQATFDSVLLDIGLPAMDGYEVARHLRELPGGRDVQLVAITGYGQYNDVQRSFDAGFNHHLVKPIDIGALTGLLRSVDAATTP